MLSLCCHELAPLLRVTDSGLLSQLLEQLAGLVHDFQQVHKHHKYHVQIAESLVDFVIVITHLHSSDFLRRLEWKNRPFSPLMKQGIP